MPRGFNDKEKALIKQNLLEKGRHLFGTYGLKRTTIADLTREAGIAQGSFYNFYDSKEDLYFEILEIEESQLKEELLRELNPWEKHPRQYLKQMLHRSLAMVDEYPLIAQMYLDNTMDILVRKLSDEKLERHFNKDKEDLLPLIIKWQQKGILRADNPEIITGLIRSLLLLSLHKKEIGEKVYSGTMTLLVDLIAEGLTQKEI